MNFASIIRAHQLYWASPEEGAAVITQIEAGEDVTSRSNWNGHVTASALVVSVDYTQVLMIDALKFGKLLLPGGHLDPGESALEAARRELREETGVYSVQALEFSGRILPLEINSHWIAASEKRAEPKHLHHDFVYPFVVVGSYSEALVGSIEANSVGWRPISELQKSYPKSAERFQAKKDQRK